MSSNKNNWILFFIVLIAILSITALNYINNRREHYIREFDLNQYEFNFYRTNFSDHIDDSSEKKMKHLLINGNKLKGKIINNNHSIIDVIELNHLNDKINWILIKISDENLRKELFNLNEEDINDSSNS